jgi:hypothetical protein
MVNKSLSNIIDLEEINNIAWETGFIKRERKISAIDFFLILVFRTAKHIPVSLRNLASFNKILVSRIAIHYRFNKWASLFFRKCLQYILSEQIKEDKIEDVELLDKFTDIKIVDSTGWNLPAGLENIFPGSGGNGSPAGCKIQFMYTYKTGSIYSLALNEGTLPDQRYSKEIIYKVNSGDLIIFDLGYWRFKTLDEINKKGAYFVSRFNTRSNLFLKRDDGFIGFDLYSYLRECQEDSIEFHAYLEEDQEFRFVAFRVPEETANKRKAKLKRDAKKEGRAPKEKSLYLCSWSIFITNCSENMFRGEMIRSLYRLRWTIELIFKNWKSILNIHRCNVKHNEYRLLCELYAKLIFALIINSAYHYLNTYLWRTEGKEISFWCIWKYITDHAQLLHETIKLSVNRFFILFDSYLLKMLKNCVKYHQPSRKTTLQQIDEIIGDIVCVKVTTENLLCFAVQKS